MKSEGAPPGSYEWSPTNPSTSQPEEAASSGMKGESVGSPANLSHENSRDPQILENLQHYSSH